MDSPSQTRLSDFTFSSFLAQFLTVPFFWPLKLCSGFFLCLSHHLLLLLQVVSVVSDPVRPHRQQPTRLPCPWDSPGKNTGVGCHCLLQCMKVKVKVKSLSRVRLFATAWTAAHQAPPSMRFSRQEYWSGLPLLSL